MLKINIQCYTFANVLQLVYSANIVSYFTVIAELIFLKLLITMAFFVWTLCGAIFG